MEEVVGGAMSEDMVLIVELTGEFTVTRCCFLLIGNDEREGGEYNQVNIPWKRSKVVCSIC